MMHRLLKVDVDQEPFERLIEQALDERRSIGSQAAVVLRLALGLPWPPPRETVDPPSPAPN